MAPVQFASLRGLAAGDEILLFGARAGSCGELASLRIDGFLDNSGRRLEILGVGVSGQSDSAFHEFRPDRSGGLAAGEAEVAIVVKADPDDAEKIGGEAGEPAVARCTGLPCCRRGKAERTDRSASAAIDDVFHQTGGEKGDARIENGARF